MKENVTIIVPIYNSEKYLKKCIESIIDQSYSELHIILINDGSTDDSRKICKTYAEKDWRIQFIDQSNQGVSAARNTGIKYARGTYIIFVDSDDFLERNAVEQRVKNWHNDKLTISGFYHEYNNNSNQFLEIHQYSQVEEVSDIPFSKFAQLYAMGAINSPCDKIYLRKIIIDNNISFNEKLSLGEDLLFNLHYLSFVKQGFIFVNEPVYHCVNHGNASLCNRFREDLFEIYVKLNKELLSFCINHDVSKENRVKIYQIYLNNIISSADNIFLNTKSYSVFKKISRISRIIDSNEMKEVLFFLNMNSGISRTKYYLLKYRFYLIYKVFSKIGAK